MSEETIVKKGFFSKLSDIGSNLIFEKDETSEVGADISVSNSESANIAPIASIVNLNIPTSGNGVFDQKFNDSFQALIEENNMPGIDYFELRQAIKNMSGIAGLNEAACFQTAFTTLKVGDPSLSKEKLMKSVDHYVKVLTNEEKEFNAELSSKTDVEVITRRSKVESLNDENNKLVQQITDINEKIRKNQEEAIKLNGEASTAEANIGQTSKNFIITLAHVKSTLETDKQKITTLITE